MSTVSCGACRGELPSAARFCPSCGTPRAEEAAWRDPLVGSLVQRRYRVQARLGDGGMAIVYLARHEVLDRDVALKVLRPEVEREPGGVARFAREAKAASRIDHPNVVSVLDFGRAEKGFFYLVMEYVVGRELAADLALRKPWPLPRAAHVLAQVAAAVGRAHELGVVHRDLKPENVLLTSRGADADFVKVVDFGLAKALNEPALTRAGDVFGTPQYMAPEQWRGQPADARADVYALGVMAYELVAGRIPFEAPTLSELMRKHLRETPRPPSEHRVGAPVPESLDALVLRCLEKDRDRRPSSTGEIVRGLSSVLAMAPARSRYTSYGALMPRHERRHESAVVGPTLLQADRVHAVWDGPALAEEISRLHALRGRRLAELSDALWPGAPPEEVRTLLGALSGFESEVERAGETIAILRARLDDAERAAMEAEALARVELITANLVSALAVEAAKDAQLALAPTRRAVGSTVPTDDDDDSTDADLSLDLDPATSPIGAASDAALAERRLATIRRRWDRQRASLEDEICTELAALRSAETSVVPLHERLSEIVRVAAARRVELRPMLVGFGAIDGALATYQALLEAMPIGP